MRRCLTFKDGRYEVLSAWDEMLLSGLATGAEAAVGSTFNFAAPIYHKMIDAFINGDINEAQMWQDRALDMINRIFSCCGRAGLKAMMSLRGIDCGPQRLPITSAAPEKIERLKKEMDNLGFFEWL